MSAKPLALALVCRTGLSAGKPHLYPQIFHMYRTWKGP